MRPGAIARDAGAHADRVCAHQPAQDPGADDAGDRLRPGGWLSRVPADLAPAPRVALRSSLRARVRSHRRPVCAISGLICVPLSASSAARICGMVSARHLRPLCGPCQNTGGGSHDRSRSSGWPRSAGARMHRSHRRVRRERAATADSRPPGSPRRGTRSRRPGSSSRAAGRSCRSNTRPRMAGGPP